MSGIWVTLVGLNRIKDRSTQDKMEQCSKVNTVSLTVDFCGTSGRRHVCLSQYFKETRITDKWMWKQFHFTVYHRGFVCHLQPFLHSLNQTQWNDTLLFNTAWRSYPWNKICVTNPDEQYISQDISLQTFTAHWLWLNFLSMVQYTEVRLILGRGFSNLSS